METHVHNKMDDIILYYIEDIEEKRDALISMYQEHYGHDWERRLNIRVPWYKENRDYRLLVAEFNGHLVGQSCAYEVDVCISLGIRKMWWGVDTFVLKSMRGKGIGKKLQAKLHSDLPNFSSAWYSNINGIVKKKLGANELFTPYFVYYPISKYYLSYLERFNRKVFKINKRLSCPFPIYSFYKKRNKNYNIKECQIISQNTSMLNTWLAEAGYDFYVDRSWNFMKWKYVDNPNLRYHAVKVIKDGEMCGLVCFSEIHNRVNMGINMRVSCLLDWIFSPDKPLTLKDAILIIADYYSDKEKLDGIMALGLTDYYPRWIEKPIHPLLTTMEVIKIKKPYLTYIDQDMEKM
jgi:GNAT superfamily N-acetyltransferase